MTDTKHEDDELLDALGIDISEKEAEGYTPREERIIAGFDDIVRFYETHGRAPRHDAPHDIFERLHAARLDRLRALPEARDLLAALDAHGLIAGTAKDTAPPPDVLDDDALLAELGESPLPDTANAAADITVLRHVRAPEDRRIAEEIASRTPCKDFKRYKPLFARIENDLKGNIRQTVKFGNNASIAAHNYFILGGQLAYVAEVGEPIKAPNGASDARLRVIYSNGTESDLLLRSLQRALYKDESGRRVTDPDLGPLFSGDWENTDEESGTIYVLRSQSNHPFIAGHRELIHKIGVTGGDVKTRVSNAANDSTYLLAEVEIVATYKLSKINRAKLENLLHKIFAPAQIDITLQDRFGRPVSPKEWYLAPLQAIDEAIQRIIDGTITAVVYDLKTARLVEAL